MFKTFIILWCKCNTIRDTNSSIFFLSFPFFSFSSGAVVANRLSEIEDWNILLLEAGGDETEISDVPLFAGYLQLSQLDWQYKTEPQGDACLGI